MGGEEEGRRGHHNKNKSDSSFSSFPHPLRKLRKIMSKMFRWKKDGDVDDFNVDRFYDVKPDCDDVPTTRFKPKLGKTLSERKWRSAFNHEGYLDIGKVLSRIQRGGIHPSIRGEVWEFLLGCFDPNSTFTERNTIRTERRKLYARLKADCQAMDATVGSGRIITTPRINQDGTFIEIPGGPKENGVSGGSSKNLGTRNLDQYGVEVIASECDNAARPPIKDQVIIQWMLNLHQIGLDVVRTDRSLKFYESTSNLAKLWDILAVYAWKDKDIGYCQGMSDLCSPMVILLGDEADAFWCFERLMRRLRGNFKCTPESVGVQEQLQTLASVIEVLDPVLHKHLEELGGGGYIFAFRMLMVLFRREFSFGDSLYLWEMMWALEYDPETAASYQDTGNLDDPETAASYQDTGNLDENRIVNENRREKIKRQCGKFERANIKNGLHGSHETPISVFLAASVLEAKSSYLLQKTQGLDDVVKILNEMTGKLDAKKACSDALKLQKKYINKTKKKVH